MKTANGARESKSDRKAVPRRALHRLSVVLAALALLAVAPSLAAQVSLASVVELAAKNSPTVHLAQADVDKARAALSESHGAFIPAFAFGSGLPAFPEIGFTGDLPTLWYANVSSMVFSMPQIRYIHAARAGLDAAIQNLKDADEQVALDASTAYIELDTVSQELAAAHEQEGYANRLVEIEQQRAEAGVDPMHDLLTAQLTAAQLKLKRLHLETRAATLAYQLADMTGLPQGSLVTDHASIPEIPAVTANQAARSLPRIQSAQLVALSKQYVAKGDEEHTRLYPEITFGILYNRNTTVLNEINKYYANPLPANNFSSGFAIRLGLFDYSARARSRQSAADALRAKVEAEQAERQNDLQISSLSGSIRELDAQAEIAHLKKQIADDQLKTVLSETEFGNGSGAGPGAAPQVSPKTEQQARIEQSTDYSDALDAEFDLSKARLNLLRALGHMQDWLNELHK
jgi:outer membrane protein TolC